LTRYFFVLSFVVDEIASNFFVRVQVDWSKTMDDLKYKHDKQFLRRYIIDAVKAARASMVVENNNTDDGETPSTSDDSDAESDGTEPETPAIVRTPAFIDLTGDDNNVQTAGVAGVATIANRSYVVISDDEDNGAVHAGRKRKAARIAERTNKLRKLDLAKDNVRRHIEEALVHRTPSTDMRATLFDNVNVRESPPFIGRPALLLGPDLTDRDSLFVREDRLEPGSGPLTPEYKMLFAMESDIRNSYPSHIRKSNNFGPDDPEYWARFRGSTSPQGRHPGPSACRRGSDGAVQSKIVDAQRRE
jgi:hypothetical protein